VNKHHNPNQGNAPKEMNHMKDILAILTIAACPLSMLAMGAAARLSSKLSPGRHKNADQPARAEQAARSDSHGLGGGSRLPVERGIA
jgi:hypothetical protein